MTIANNIEDWLQRVLNKIFYIPDEKHMLQFFVHMLLWSTLSVLNGILLHKSLLWYILTGFLVVFPVFKEIVLDNQRKLTPDMATDLASYYIGMLGLLAYYLR